MRKILCFVFLFTAFVVNAQNWNGSTTVGNPVCTFSPSTQKLELVSCKDGNGGMWIAWSDLRNTSTPNNSDIYLQKINSNGTLAFANEGLVVCNALKSQGTPAIVADANGGCLIVWSDQRDSTTNGSDIYMQKFANNGMPIFTANGIPVSNATSNQILPVVSLMDMNSILVAWSDDRNNATFSTSRDYFCNSFNIITGAKSWTNDLEIVRGNFVQTNLRLLSQGGLTGDVFAVWQDPRVATTNADIYAQKITSTGTVSWAANGINLTAAATNNQGNPQVISDGGTGIIITWDDNRTANNDQAIYAQKLNTNGVEQWPTGGVLIADVTGSTNNQRSPYLTTDGNGGAIIAWQDTRNTATSSSDIYAQKVSTLGIVRWAANGILICDSIGSQPNSTASGFSVVDDNAYGAIIIWDDARNGTSNIDVMAQRVDSFGNRLWSPINGVAVANRTGSNQRTVTTVLSDGNDYIVAWLDGRTATNGEIYANKLIGSTGLLPLQFVQVAATKNKEYIDVNWVTANEVNVSHFEIEKRLQSNEFKTISKITATNKTSNKYNFTDFNVFSGKNAYRIKSVDKDGKTQFSNVIVVDNLHPTKQEIVAFPNPTKNNFTLQITTIKEGRYELRVLNTNSKYVLNNTLQIKGTINQVSLDSKAWASGVYVCQLIDNYGKVVLSTKIIKN
jgi:hypothetical protein